MSQPEPFYFMDCGKVLRQYCMQKLNDTANDAHEKNMCIDWRDVFAGTARPFHPLGDLPAYDCLKWSPRASLHSKDEDDWSHDESDFEINLPFKGYRTEKSRSRNTKALLPYLFAKTCFHFIIIFIFFTPVLNVVGDKIKYLKNYKRTVSCLAAVIIFLMHTQAALLR